MYVDHYDKLGNYYATALDISRTMRELVESLARSARIAQRRDRSQQLPRTPKVRRQKPIRPGRPSWGSGIFGVTLNRTKTSAEVGDSQHQVLERPDTGHARSSRACRSSLAAMAPAR